MGLGNLGFGEVLLLVVLGLVIFGPDRLPRAVSDAAKMLRQLRTMAKSAADDLKTELGPELAEFGPELSEIRNLHPRRFVEHALFGEDEPSAVTGTAAVAPVALAEGERPPYDDDAT